ncbi:11538_t:CDS:1, partial [Racocetra fulgida]
ANLEALYNGSSITFDWSIAHNGFNLWIPANYTTYDLEFTVSASKSKEWRGPFDNNQDY